MMFSAVPVGRPVRHENEGEQGEAQSEYKDKCCLGGHDSEIYGGTVGACFAFFADAAFAGSGACSNELRARSAVRRTVASGYRPPLRSGRRDKAPGFIQTSARLAHVRPAEGAARADVS